MHENESREKWLPPSGTYTKPFGHGSTSIRTSRPAKITIIFIIFITGLVCTWKVVLKDNPVQEPTLVRSQNDSSSLCRRIHSYPTTTDRERCYPLLINFGHQCCLLAQKNNCLTGLKHGIQQCLMLNKKILDADPGFVNRNKNILDRQRGAGYWLWKPYIILQELYLARDGDIIVYSDAAVNFTNDISHLTKLTSKQDIVLFELADWKESMFTKRDALIILDADKPEYTKTQAGIASYLVVKRSFSSLRFISEWLTYAQDHRVITDDENELGSSNYPDFRAHRHDQSTLSLVAKKWNLTFYPDPSQWGEKVNRPYPTIFNHHRSKN